MGWATFWVIFLQTHLVTLPPGVKLSTGREEPLLPLRFSKQ
jgi:hypothetical protein